MKLKYFTLLLIFGAISFSIGSCGGEECDSEGITYSNYAGAFIDSNCGNASCHGAGTVATFPMNDYASAKTAADFGRIVGSINHDADFSNMPKGGDKLDDCDIEKLTAWIADGAPE